MKTKIIVILLSSFAILYVIYILAGVKYSIHQVNEHEKLEPAKVSDSVVSEYLELIHRYDTASVIPRFAFITAARPPFSKFDLKNGNCLIISKLTTADSIDFATAFIAEKGETEPSMDSVYNGVNEKLFHVYHLTSHPKLKKELYIRFDGDSTYEMERDDSTISYYFKARGFSIRYTKDGTVDIYGKTKAVPIPMEIYFLKRNKNLYFALLSVNSIDSLELVNPFVPPHSANN